MPDSKNELLIRFHPEAVGSLGYSPLVLEVFSILTSHGVQTIRSSTHWEHKFVYVEPRGKEVPPAIRLEDDILYPPYPAQVEEALVTLRAVFPEDSDEPGSRVASRIRPISGVRAVELPKVTEFVGPGEQKVGDVPAGWHKPAVHWVDPSPSKVSCIAVLDNGCYHQDQVAYRRDSESPAALHGTQVAAVILDLLPNASLQAWKITEGDSGFIDKPLLLSDSSEYLTALRDIRNPASGVRVVNISRGQPDWTMIEKEEMDLLEEAGILVVAAAGNTTTADDSCVDFPAALPTVLSVGAVEYEREGEKAGWHIWSCSRHSFNLKQLKCLSKKMTAVDLVAPGVFIQVPTLRKMPLSGTSFATPIVSALAGLLFTMYPELTPAEVRKILKESCTPWPGRPHEAYGKGLLHWERALSLAGEHFAARSSKGQGTPSRGRLRRR